MADNKKLAKAKKAASTPEEQREKRLMVLTPIVSVLLALIVGAIVIACLGKSPIQGYAAMLQGSLGDAGKIGKTLERACPLIFTGLAAVFAYKCGVFNLGGEGQFIMGGCATATVALIPGIMKITRGLNEMITSIMLNYIAMYFMEYIFKNVFSDQGLPKTLAMPKSTHLMDVGSAHVGVILAIVLGVFLWYVIFRTSFGFKIRAVGMSPTASKVNGFPVRALVLLAFVISGAIAGMGGAVELLGKTPFRLADGFGSGFGFDGVAIALIAQLNPIAAIFVAIVDIVRGLIIIFAVAGMAMVKLPKVKAFFANLGSKNKKAEVNA